MAVPFNIRPAKRSDCGSIATLIKELASYEKMAEKALLDEKDLERDGFGDTPYYHCLVAEIKNDLGESVTIGYALYFYIYSTWNGKSLYMEDLYVQPQHRKKGIGKALLQNVAKIADSTGCTRLDFAVLDWNMPSIEFYKSKGAVDLTESCGWHAFRIADKPLRDLANTD